MVPKYLSQADADRAIARARLIKEALAEERTKARSQVLREVLVAVDKIKNDRFRRIDGKIWISVDDVIVDIKEMQRLI